MHLVGNYDVTKALFENTEPMFNGYEEFLQYMRKKQSNLWKAGYIIGDYKWDEKKLLESN